MEPEFPDADGSCNNATPYVSSHACCCFRPSPKALFHSPECKSDVLDMLGYVQLTIFDGP